MKASRVYILVAAASILIGAGCRRHETSPPGTETARSSTAVAPPATIGGTGADAARAVLLDSVNLGRGLNPDGTVSTPGTVFRQGDPVFVSFRVAPISPGTELKLVWLGPRGTTNGQEQMVVPPAADVVNFRAKDTRTWLPGDHRLEIWMGGARVGDKAFRIDGTVTAANVPSR
jgi:hypothetical protein